MVPWFMEWNVSSISIFLKIMMMRSSMTSIRSSCGLWTLRPSSRMVSKPDLAEEEVLLITLKNFKTKKLITFGSRPYTVKRDDVEYVLCSSEYELLNNFVAWWEDVQPEVITGWNVDLFDTTYLCNRIQKVVKPFSRECHLGVLPPVVTLRCTPNSTKVWHRWCHHPGLSGHL